MNSAIMDSSSSTGSGWLIYMLPMLGKAGGSSLSITGFVASCWLPLLLLLSGFVASALVCWCFPGGPAWGSLNSKKLRSRSIPGPRGLPVVGSLLEMGGLAHRRLADLARTHSAKPLMALSLGSTRLVISSAPDVARELLNSTAFADRPLKQSAQQLMFGRAVGFAPYGDYWRRLRRVALSCLFSPRRIAAHEPLRQRETDGMLAAIEQEAMQAGGNVVQVRGFLQRASLNSVMGSVFGRRFEGEQEKELQGMVREGFELLGAFNWADHMPWLQEWDPQGVVQRCRDLVPRVNAFVQRIIDEHRQNSVAAATPAAAAAASGDSGDFVDVLLSLQGEDKLEDADMVAVLWEMIFRGTDTTAILTEWVLAELVLNPCIQRKLQSEIDSVCSSGNHVRDCDVEKMPYLQAVVNETLRLHPPGPLLSWARLAVHDVDVAGYHVPAGTTAMVNMWAITHDSAIWSQPDKFIPERFVEQPVDVRGNDLRLAPFGAGRRVCPGRALGLSTVRLWVARLVQHFFWMPSQDFPVDVSEVLKLSCEMVKPLKARPVPRSSSGIFNVASSSM